MGEQGTGKTSAATKMLAALLDPSPAQVRRAPRDVETWTTAAAGSWVVALDNLSGISDQISDALCRASTGDGDVRRRLYSDGDLHVIAFRRVVFVNGIDLGVLHDDLADWLVTVTLNRLADYQRRKDADMAEAWRVAHPRVLGALLDLACAVLREVLWDCRRARGVAWGRSECRWRRRGSRRRGPRSSARLATHPG
ncbi:MAG: hypothetical protein ACRDQ4_27605 [Pseudonocardiaceae bacterium]